MGMNFVTPILHAVFPQKVTKEGKGNMLLSKALMTCFSLATSCGLSSNIYKAFVSFSPCNMEESYCLIPLIGPLI